MNFTDLKKGETYELTIEDWAWGGKGIARMDEKSGVVFVPRTIPGQKISARIVKKKKRYAEGVLVEVLERSPHESDTNYQVTSGGPFVEVDIAKQREWKQALVAQSLKQFANVDMESVWDEYIASPVTHGYRNKMQYSFGPTTESQDAEGNWTHGGFGLGPKYQGKYWLTDPLVRPSGLFDAEFELLLSGFAAQMESTGLAVYNTKTGEGFFRMLEVRKSFAEDAFLIHLVTTKTGVDDFDTNLFTEYWRKHLGTRVKGIAWTATDAVNDGNIIEQPVYLWGEKTFIESVSGLDFEVSLESFFQPNPACAELLYAKALDYIESTLEPESPGILLDLFCGTGTIGQLVASRFSSKQIMGIDIVPQAIADARANAERNNITNVEFIAADVKKFLTERSRYFDTIDAIVMDPPRAGIVPKALDKLIKLESPHIVYISCNPVTFARDIAVMAESGYELKKFSLVDQFPHTAHVECVGLLQKC